MGEYFEGKATRNRALAVYKSGALRSVNTHTQKRKLQRLRNKEKKEREEEKMRDEEFNRYRPMFPQSKV